MLHLILMEISKPLHKIEVSVAFFLHPSSSVVVIFHACLSTLWKQWQSNEEVRLLWINEEILTLLLNIVECTVCALLQETQLTENFTKDSSIRPVIPICLCVCLCLNNRSKQQLWQQPDRRTCKQWPSKVNMQLLSHTEYRKLCIIKALFAFLCSQSPFLNNCTQYKWFLRSLKTRWNKWAWYCNWCNWLGQRHIL